MAVLHPNTAVVTVLYSSKMRARSHRLPRRLTAAPRRRRRRGPAPPRGERRHRFAAAWVQSPPSRPAAPTMCRADPARAPRSRRRCSAAPCTRTARAETPASNGTRPSLPCSSGCRGACALGRGEWRARRATESATHSLSRRAAAVTACRRATARGTCRTQTDSRAATRRARPASGTPAPTRR